jgi:hypothetical protein
MSGKEEFFKALKENKICCLNCDSYVDENEVTSALIEGSEGYMSYCDVCLNCTEVKED